MTAEREALEAICACYPKNSNAHRIASQALANPATGDDADAEWLMKERFNLAKHDYEKVVRLERIASRLAIPSEPTEGSRT